MSAREFDSPPDAGVTMRLHVGSAAGERLLGWLLLAGAVALLALSLAPNAVTRFYTWPTIFYWHVLLALPLLVFVLGAASRRPLPRLGLALDLGAFLWAAGALSAAWLSPHRPASVPAALLPVASVALAYIMRGWLGFDSVASRRRARQAFMAIGVLAAVWVFASFSYWIAADVLPAGRAGVPWFRWLQLRNAHPFGHSNYTAGFVVLVLPVFAGLVATSRAMARRGWTGMTVLAVGLLVATGSRGGVLAVCGLLGGVVVFALTRRELSRPKRLGVGLALLIGAVLLVALSPRLRGLFSRATADSSINESNRQRLAMLEAGWAMGRDRPWLGHGPGTVSLAYPHYRARLSGGVENVLELHSAPVQVWAETGVVGGLALVALALGVGMRAWRLRVGGSAAQAGTADDRRRAWALVFALGGYAIFSVTDHQLDVPLFAGTLAAMLALLSALTRPAGLADVTWSPTFVRAVPAAAVAGAGVFLAWHIGPDLRARQAFVHGVIALEQGDADGFRAGTQRARGFAPWEPFYLNQLAFHHLAEADRAGDGPRASTLRALAVGALQRSLAVSPEQEICLLNLGWLALEARQSVDAARYFRAAARLVPDKGGVYFGLGLALLQQDREGDATRAFALEWINDPRSLGREVWSRADWQERRRAVGAVAGEMLVELTNAPEAVAQGRTLNYLRAALAWWISPRAEFAALANAAADGPEARKFFQIVGATSQEIPPDGSAAWCVLARAWLANADADLRAALPPALAPWTDALARRVASRRTSLAEFFTAPVRRDEELIRASRVLRPAYGMLARNSDGLQIIDLTIHEENILTAQVLAPVLPVKGWLSGPALLRLLATIPE